MDDEKNELNQPEEKTEKARGSKRTASKSSKRKKADPGRFMIARLLGLVCAVLVVFEGRITYTLFTHRVGSSIEVMSSRDESSGGEDLVESTEGSDGSSGSSAGGSASTSLGLAGAGSGQDGSAETADTVPEENPEAIDSPAVVPLVIPSVDDSYFSNAVFIGDSRMEGFRNSSGITQGTFLTSVGLSTNDIDSGKQLIATADGTISVYQGLSGRQYDRIYLMLGANDLGYYPWDSFLPTFKRVLEQFHALQPHAIIYVCSVIYVDESKVAAGFEYDNNENVRTINGFILEACEELWYSYYLNLNEIFSNGYGALLSDASSDGIHLYAQYLEDMLDYLKSHYITDEAFSVAIEAHPEDFADTSSGEETEAAADEIISDDTVSAN